MIDIGTEAAFVSAATRVQIDGWTYFVVRTGAGFRLYSAICPHQGGVVRDTGTGFECPRHGWRFDPMTGHNLTAPGQGLTSFEVTARNGRLWADLTAPTTVVAPPVMPLATSPFRVTLLAHSCLELEHAGFRLLADPWLEGPAFFGAWIQSPPPRVSASELRPDAIWISHEHSDHFHEATLRCLSRSTPVYFPAFPNGRLDRRLGLLGFSDRRPMRFGERTEIAPGFALTVFEPASLWNDAILLVEAGNVRLLNLNDAGLNLKVAALVGRVDVVASTFSYGASGYPLTWTHLSADEKDAIMRRANAGLLEMLAEAAAAHQAHAILPIASHFRLWHPDHAVYEAQLRRNRLDDVVAAFADSTVRVLDLRPGDAWLSSTGAVVRAAPVDHGQGDHPGEIVFDEARFRLFHPPQVAMQPEVMDAYFVRLNDVPEMAFCENLTVSICAVGDDATPPVTRTYQIANGRLTVGDASDTPNVTIAIPAGILRAIIDEDDSWDEAHLGYWCTMRRSPDIYHAAFWRLLQSPYYRRPVPSAQLSDRSIGADSIVASVLERYGDPADRLLRRYGLYCLGCAHSTADTIGQAARTHGVDSTRVDQLLIELGALTPSDQARRH